MAGAATSIVLRRLAERITDSTTSVPRLLLTACPVPIPIAQNLSDETYPTVVAVSATLMATRFWTTSLVTWPAP